ncbi:nicotinic acid mononucleotide adenyltransferase [Aquimarina sp. ERC-38]|uniref:toxin-antitoxin system YwqK family antitoxin n=1 Tax=Aquimarina sp. ERC-38 TaxID=2949996 RepID=UPI0022451200|nr:nicotinic acid mononucleotide adenyltransferase [Aquimarina sp. ERC-38]UZO81584.1 nicotinic acid mononucleotide adenyltransferase [Aquimarina sp. ERC-38]
MKNIGILMVMLCTLSITAQNKKPLFEKEGNLVKGTFYHENGQISQQGFYSNKKLHGKWSSFDNNGKKIAMGQYENGAKTGKWFFWNNDKLSEVNYVDNSIAEVTTWSEKNDVVGNFK